MLTVNLEIETEVKSEDVSCKLFTDGLIAFSLLFPRMNVRPCMSLTQLDLPSSLIESTTAESLHRHER